MRKKTLCYTLRKARIPNVKSAVIGTTAFKHRHRVASYFIKSRSTSHKSMVTALSRHQLFDVNQFDAFVNTVMLANKEYCCFFLEVNVSLNSF